MLRHGGPFSSNSRAAFLVVAVLRRLLATVFVVVFLVVTLAVVLVRDLDNPAVKRRLQTLVRQKVGVEIDYGKTQVRLLSGLRLTDLVVQSPPRFRPLAGELLRVGTVEIGWSLRALLHHQIPLTRVALDDLHATVVHDADGKTSLSELLAGIGSSPSSPSPAKLPPPPPSPPTPLSRLAADLLAGSAPLNEAFIHRVDLTLLLRDEHNAVEKLHLAAPELALHLTTASAPSGWQVKALLGDASSPVALHLDRTHGNLPTGQASAALWLDAAVTPTDAQAELDLRMLHQTLLPTVQIGHLVHVGAHAHFDHKAGRIDVALSPLALADDAATLTANVELPDKGPPVVRLARGAANLQPLYNTLSAEVTPIHAKLFQLNFDLAELTLTAAPRLAPGGHADVQGDIEALRIMLAGEDLTLVSGKLAIKAAPTADHGTTLSADLPLQGLRMLRGATENSCASLHIAIAGSVDPAGAVTGDANLRFSGLLRALGSAGAITQRLAARDGHLAVHATELSLELAAPPPAAPTPTPAALPHTTTLLKHRRLAKRAVHAHLSINGQVDGLDVLYPALHSEAQSVGITAEAQLTGGAPYGLDLDLPIQGLKLANGKGLVLHNGPTHLVLHAAEVYPDPVEPRHIRGDVTLVADLANTHAEITAHKHPQSVDFELSAEAKSLAAVRSILTATGGLTGFEIPWDNMALSIKSQGKVEQLFSTALALSQHSEVSMTRPALKSATGDVAAQGLTLVTNTSGNSRRQSGDLDVKVRGLKVSDQSFDDVHLTAGAELDLLAPSVKLRLLSDAKAGPQASITAALSFDRGKKTLAYDVAVQAAKLLPLQPFLAKLRAARGFDLSALDLSLKSSGTVVGLVDSVTPGLSPRLYPNAKASIAIAGTIDLGATGVYWNEADRVVKSPRVGWHATLSHKDKLRTLHGDLALEALHVEFGDHELDFGKVDDSLDLTMDGELGRGEGEMKQHLKLSELQQDFVDGYVLSSLTLSLQAQRNRDGELRIGELKLQNDGGGTELDLSGHLEVGEERRSMHLHGTLNQQLDRLWNKSDVYVGHGAVALKVDVHSGNFSLFHTQAEVQVSDGNVTLPRRHITIEGFSGEVPILADVLVDHNGIHLVHNDDANVYSQLRYADQHPLMSGRSFISVARIATPLFDVAGLAGNLRIEHTRFSLNQFELGTRGGQVTGLCLLDVRDDGPTVQLRIRASHITSSHGERFDGNAAVVLGVRDRSVSGRAEILRIGRRHLLDLLDLHDPHHSDPSVNRVRTALSLGYPDRVSLGFDHGFATARISFGGLAGLVRIDPLRGIPMGPIIDKLLPPVADTEDEQ